MQGYSFLIHVKGIVQGIGFRPFIYRLASEYGFSGYVKNTSKGVEILISNASIESAGQFCSEIHKNHPPGGIILNVDIEKTDFSGTDNFTIIPSDNTGGITAIPPDLSVCSDCLAEISDPDNRRYMYPFANCTNCGPRYSIVESIPYDRYQTTMNEFVMCDNCLLEYNDIHDRRYHAQPVCCGRCGPEIFFGDTRGIYALKMAAEKINNGGIVALKGLGGYQIICNASCDSAVKQLREIKQREFKPFALMVKSLKSLKKYSANIADHAERIFNSSAAPIVIREWGDLPVSPYINPSGKKTGIMKACTPLHYILFDFLKTDFIVATSGNIRDEPIYTDEVEAHKNLNGIVKYFLDHNRAIYTRVDDSVVSVLDGDIYVLRRARGFAPSPVILPKKSGICVAGMGAHLKNTLTFAKDEYAFVSQHIGDLDNPKSCDFYDDVFKKINGLFHLEPQIIVTDLHQGYFSSTYPEKKGFGHIIKVQHHEAHMYSCMAENKLTNDVIGVIFDGTGLGTDGKIWGGEFFHLNGDLRRMYHLKYYTQPGMDSAAKYPARMLAGYLYQMDLLEEYRDIIENIIPFRDISLIKKIIDGNVNSIETSSAGRLFEAAGSLITGFYTNEYEGFSAIAMENLLDDNFFMDHSRYEFEIKDDDIHFKNFFEGTLSDLKNDTTPEVIALKLHNSVAFLINDVCKRIGYANDCKNIVLSGGVFQNMYLLQKTKHLLTESGFNVCTHRYVPANDGGISLGQVYYYILNN